MSETSGSGVDWSLFQKAVCTHLGMQTEEVSEVTNIYSDIGLDSLGIVSLGMYLQAQFKVVVPLSEVSTIQTVGDMYQKLLEYSPQNRRS